MKARWRMLAIFAAVLAATLALAVTSWAAVISNSSPISIPDSGKATPYPATINVSGLSGTTTDVNVTLHGVSHTFADDVAVLLVGPSGQNVMLMSDAGGGQDLNSVDLTFDDEAATRLPDGAGTQITTRSYRPTQGANSADKVPSSLPTPAPAGPYGTSLSVFDGAADPNGTYSLYVYDDSSGDAGQLAGGFSLDIKTTTEAATDLKPDLRMARLQDLQIERTGDRKLLRFDSIIVNVGDGAFEAHGSRKDTASPEMTVTQRIFDDQGGHKNSDTTARMYFAGDGHTHWHVRDLQDYVLRRLDNGKLVGTGAKHGFCFFDNYRYGSTQGQFYTRRTSPPASGQTSSDLAVKMGLSVGWGDIYQSSLPDQYIDVTGLTSGRYKLRATADADNWFAESNNSNNSTWVNIRISGDKVRVIR